MRPVIGVMPLYDKEKDSYWMLPGYLQALERCGALPLMLPLTESEEELAQCLELCDGLLFTGGQDVSPAVYGEAALPCCGETCPARDAMERFLLRAALERDLPVFGICRGAQFFNALLGGTLYQDLGEQHPGEVCHRMRPPYDGVAHTVRLLPGTPLAAWLGRETLPVNSCHHQGIRTVAPGLKPMAVAPDGLVEGIYLPGKRFAMAVQWHPEFSFRVSADSVCILQHFVDACRA